MLQARHRSLVKSPWSWHINSRNNSTSGVGGAPSVATGCDECAHVLPLANCT